MTGVNMLRERIMKKQGASNNMMQSNPIARMRQGMMNAFEKKMESKCKGTRCGSTRVKGGW